MYSVQSMQYYIVLFGHRSVAIDGKMGPETKAGIKAVQRSFEIDADGVWGPITEGHARPAVTALQRQLKALGYALSVDGIPGPETVKAVKGFQADHGLTVDGIVGPATSGMLIAEDPGLDPNHLPNFTADEFKCPCGCGGDVTPEMKRLMQLVRNGMNDRLHDGKDHPLVITSGFRCPRQNRIEGGIADSLHLQGLAVDCYTPGMNDRCFEALIGAAHRLGLTCGRYNASGFVHVQMGRNDFIGD